MTDPLLSFLLRQEAGIPISYSASNFCWWVGTLAYLHLSRIEQSRLLAAYPPEYSVPKVVSTVVRPARSIPSAHQQNHYTTKIHFPDNYFCGKLVQAAGIEPATPSRGSCFTDSAASLARRLRGGEWSTRNPEPLDSPPGSSRFDRLGRHSPRLLKNSSRGHQVACCFISSFPY